MSHPDHHNPHESNSSMEVDRIDITSISCDSCLRAHTKCIGFPCERCQLHDFTCFYSPPEERIAELQKTFGKLVSTTQNAERLNSSKDIESNQSEGHRDVDVVMENATVRVEVVRKREPEKIGCVVCAHLHKTCGGERPKCEECDEEGFLCVYPNEDGEQGNSQEDIIRAAGSGEDIRQAGSESNRPKGCYQCERSRRTCEGGSEETGKPCSVCRFMRTKCEFQKEYARKKSYERGWEISAGLLGDNTNLARETQECDTCKVWTAYCDEEKPSCSSCLVRNVKCSYSKATLARADLRPPPPPSFFESNSTVNSSSSPSPLRYIRPPPYTASTPYHPRHARTNPAPRIFQSSSGASRRPIVTRPQATQSKQNPTFLPAVFSPPISQMYSTPSGCTSCFNHKQKCVFPSLSSSSSSSSSSTTLTARRICQHCVTNGFECKSFAPGTKLIACDACMDAERACTNVKEGLRCDGCVDSGSSCSRAAGESGQFYHPAASVLVHHPTLTTQSDRREEDSEKCSIDREEVVKGKQPEPVPEQVIEPEMRTCSTCTSLRQFCDGIEPSCSLCTEVGLSCQYPASTVKMETETAGPASSAIPQAMDFLVSPEQNKKDERVSNEEMTTGQVLPLRPATTQRGLVIASELESSPPSDLSATPNELKPASQPQCKQCLFGSKVCGGEKPSCANCGEDSPLCSFLVSSRRLWYGDGSHIQRQSREAPAPTRLSPAKVAVLKGLDELLTRRVEILPPPSPTSSPPPTGTTPPKQVGVQTESHIQTSNKTKSNSQIKPNQVMILDDSADEEKDGMSTPTSKADAADEWEEITHSEAFGVGREVEYGVMELEE